MMTSWHSGQVVSYCCFNAAQTSMCPGGSQGRVHLKWWSPEWVMRIEACTDSTIISDGWSWISHCRTTVFPLRLFFNYICLGSGKGRDRRGTPLGCWAVEGLADAGTSSSSALPSYVLHSAELSCPNTLISAAGLSDREGRGTHRLKIGWSLMNWTNLDPCLFSFTVKQGSLLTALIAVIVYSVYILIVLVFNIVIILRMSKSVFCQYIFQVL